MTWAITSRLCLFLSSSIIVGLVPIPSVTAPHTGHGVSVPGTGIDDTGASERTDWMIWIWIEIGVKTSLVQVNRRW